MTQWGSASVSYDLNGNTLNDGTNAYTWDARNRLVSANSNTSTFAYDPLGRRTSKTLLSTTTNFLYDGANPVQEQNGSGVTANLLTGGIDERFQRTDSTGSFSYLTDALGSTMALTDSTGAQQSTYTYSPYGAGSITGSTTNSYDYTGRESDGIGLHYYRARYYNPTTGRFLSEDPLGRAGGINLYAYARNNPISFRDPSGLKPHDSPLLDPKFLAMALATEAAGGGPEDPIADVVVAGEAIEAEVAAAEAAEAGSEAITGFRAVSEDELYSINEEGQFLDSPTGSESKYFSNTMEQAQDFGTRMYGEGNYGLVQGEFPSSVPVESINPATEGPGFTVPSGYLPLGQPTILWP